MKIKIDKKLIQKGYITKNKHPDLDYYIYNYTRKTQFESLWNDTTMMCRGLILDGECNVIARPFKKFFNIGEYNQHSKLGEIPFYNYFDIFEKMDGSLGILYEHSKKGYQIATRGSFESPQAIKGTQILKEKYNYIKLSNKYTFLFEIIYPENRIVVDYGNCADLYLLGIVNKETGEELEYEYLLYYSEVIGCPMAQYSGRVSYNRHAFKKLESIIPEGKEGFVIRFDNGLRVKVKSEEYKELHKILTTISIKDIWEALSNGKPYSSRLRDFGLPEDFYGIIFDIEIKFWSRYHAIQLQCVEIIKKMSWEVARDRKSIAKYFQSFKDLSSILFPMYDGKDYSHIIWKKLKPDLSDKNQQESANKLNRYRLAPYKLL